MWALYENSEQENGQNNGYDAGYKETMTLFSSSLLYPDVNMFIALIKFFSDIFYHCLDTLVLVLFLVSYFSKGIEGEAENEQIL